MNLREFHNALRVLLNLDRDVLVNAAVLVDDDAVSWALFRRDPFRWFILADDEAVKRLWALMETRMKGHG